MEKRKEDIISMVIKQKTHIIKNHYNRSRFKIQLNIIGTIAYADMYIIDNNGTEINIMSFDLGADIQGPSYLFSKFIHSMYIKCIDNVVMIYYNENHVMNITNINNHISVFELKYRDSIIKNTEKLIDYFLRDRVLITHKMSFRNGNEFYFEKYAARVYNNSFPSCYDNILESKIDLHSYKYKVITAIDDVPILLMEGLIVNDHFEFHMMPIVWCYNSLTGKYMYICAHLYLVYVSIKFDNISDINQFWNFILDKIDIKNISYESRIYVNGKDRFHIGWLEDESVFINGYNEYFDKYDITIQSSFDNEALYVTYDLFSNFYEINTDTRFTIYGIPLKDLKIKS